MVKETANVLDVLDIWRHHEARWRVRVAMRPVVDVESRLTRSSRETLSPLVWQVSRSRDQLWRRRRKKILISFHDVSPSS